jgi:2Fe-2S ferredoxin
MTAKQMCKVTFLPLQQTVETVAGETLLEVALAHDVPLHHACGGYCACTTCQVRIKDGAQNLSPMEEEEEERLARADDATPGSRLGCQAKVMGDVVVEMVHTD